MEQPGWMAEAWTHLFARERQGRVHNPEILAFFRDAGHGGIGSDEVPWCAAFVGACLERGGVSGSGSLTARSYLGWGETLARGRLGAIAVFRRGSDPSAGHVGFLVGETDDDLIVLGGNQSDAVTVARYSRQRLLGLRWPLAGRSGETGDAGEGHDPCFAEALAHVLEMEGGFTDDPHDPGGPTNKGITLATYARHVRRVLDAASRSRLLAELKAIPSDVVRAIYLAQYWRPSRAAELPAGLALMHFDASVNHGVGGAARMLQQALGVTVDGSIGPITLAAARRNEPRLSVQSYADIRRARYRSLKHFWRFGRGWLRRVDRTLARANALLDGPVPPSRMKRADNEIVSKPQKGGMMAEQTEGRARQVPQSGAGEERKWWGSSLTIWGATLTALSTVLPAFGPALGLDITPELVREAGDQLISAVQAIGGLVGTVMTIYGRSRAATRLVRREMRLNV
jgi:uncharacterized protein (TIGR02594 family)